MDDAASAERRAATGDVAAFGALVRQHQSSVRGFLRRLTKGNHALADDLAQETFLEAYRKIAQFQGQGSFLGWLHAIAWSRFLMENRKRKLEPLDEMDERVAPSIDPAIKLDLEKAMALLRAPERAALTLCFALGMPHEEAAHVMGVPLGTLKSHVARGREKLKILLKDHAP
ncbi:MAG TPA: sigma-70 family RNA polymerase sigma factor [Rhizomicrobium sp.]|nr:sigma-70 family RNA polymerase sigma factor [Rhizomicrobium sp.]